MANEFVFENEFALLLWNGKITGGHITIGFNVEIEEQPKRDEEAKRIAANFIKAIGLFENGVLTSYFNPGEWDAEEREVWSF